MNAETGIGINLSCPSDWSTEYCFNNLFYLSRDWISQQEGKGWGEGPKLDLDKEGWIKSLKPGCYADTLMLTHSNGHQPKGNYVCLYEGEGEIEFPLTDYKLVSKEPGRIVINLDTNHEGLFLRIKKTNPKNYIRNIRFLLPGSEKSYLSNPFNPRFIETCKDFNTFRFMLWSFTNDSKIVKWDDRPKLADQNFTTKGVPLEFMIRLCNETKVNPWFCMPHMADDNYIRQFAKQVKETLDPDLKIYIEYSNEVWNFMFDQYRYAEKKGAELGLMPHEGPWAGAASFYALRSKEIFLIWEEVFKGADRLNRVISWQLVVDPNYWTEERVLLQHQVFEHADVLAFAPYFGLVASPQENNPPISQIEKWSVDQVLDYLEFNSIPESYRFMTHQKKIADKYGLKFCCYEAGQHLAGFHGGENNGKITALFIAANKHPRMGSLYTKYLDNWKKLNGDLMCLFTSTAAWTKWGSWGLTQYLDDKEEDSPKLKAVKTWIKNNCDDKED